MNNIETAEQLAEIIETTGCDQRYSTMSDVCDMIADVLGDFANEHDVAAIAGETFAWYRAYDPEANVEWLNGQGYYQVVTGDDFWTVCANHAL